MTTGPLASNHTSPRDILPLPKVTPQLSKTGGRKKRRSAIITDDVSLPSKVAGCEESENIPPPPKVASCESTDYIPASPKLDGFDNPDDMQVEVGSYVLANYSTMKSQIFYVGEVLALENNDVLIDCLRRVGKTQRFRRPEIADPDAITLDRIEMVLHPETSHGTNERSLSTLAFSNIGHYNVR